MQQGAGTKMHKYLVEKLLKQKVAFIKSKRMFNLIKRAYCSGRPNNKRQETE